MPNKTETASTSDTKLEDVICEIIENLTKFKTKIENFPVKKIVKKMKRLSVNDDEEQLISDDSTSDDSTSDDSTSVDHSSDDYESITNVAHTIDNDQVQNEENQSMKSENETIVRFNYCPI